MNGLNSNFKEPTKYLYLCHKVFRRNGKEINCDKSSHCALQSKQTLRCVEDLEDFLSKFHKPGEVSIKESSPEKSQPSPDASENIKLSLCGDLSGRERITGAKRMRLGCDAPSKRFKNIYEYPALWHVKQSFLGVSAKILPFPLTTVIYSNMI